MGIINRLKYWGQLLLLPVYWFSFLMPRDRNIWLFGSTFGRRFADNPKYFYLYISQHKEEYGIRPVWLSHNREVVGLLRKADGGKGTYEAYYYHSLRGIWLALRGKIYLFDNYSKDINFWQSGGAIKINLWHGVGNKRINYDNAFDSVRHPKNLWERFKYFPRRLSDEKPSHYVLATSPIMCRIFARAFGVPAGHVIESGYPRNDYILGATLRNVYLPEEKRVHNDIVRRRKNGEKIIFYMPTFRDSESVFLDVMDLQAFHSFLMEYDLFFLVKLHPKSKLRNDFEKIAYSNITVLDEDADPYVFLGHADILVTDYSSVYSDFMLLDRPVVAFQYDYREYSRDTRGEYFSFQEYMPEQRAENMEELMDKIQKVLCEDTAKEMRAVSRKKMFSSMEADGCKRLYEKCRQLAGLQQL